MKGRISRQLQYGFKVKKKKKKWTNDFKSHSKLNTFWLRVYIATALPFCVLRLSDHFFNETALFYIEFNDTLIP